MSEKYYAIVRVSFHILQSVICWHDSKCLASVQFRAVTEVCVFVFSFIVYLLFFVVAGGSWCYW